LASLEGLFFMDLGSQRRVQNLVS